MDLAFGGLHVWRHRQAICNSLFRPCIVARVRDDLSNVLLL